MQEEIIIQFSKNEEDKLNAYKLRYEVFSLEENDLRYADKTEETYSDQIDILQNKLLIAKLKNEVIGTLRLTLKRETDFIAEHVYDFNYLSNLLKLKNEIFLNQLGIIERFVIKKEHRNLALYIDLQNYIAEYCIKNKIFYWIGGCKKELLNFHLKTGWQTYKEMTPFNNFNGYPIYFDIQKYLKTNKL